MSIWKAVKHKIQPCVLRGDLIRVVESQEQIATNALVDDLEEQIQLEKLLELSKPNNQSFNTSFKNQHYLLTTPFRYPPLLHGSRFGSRFEHGVFYASKTLSTAFSETAFYRFYFWQGMRTPPPTRKYTTEHTVFSVGYHSDQGLQLQHAPFITFADELTHPSQYHKTQRLGSDIRDAGIEIFEYTSARDINRGINIALFKPNVLTNNKPKDQQQWLCETTSEKVSFSSKENKLLSYSITDFLVNSIFPLPAN